jgi:UDP-N-acetylmuramoyl-tripeptide--D-alanyl-D-alanine ligase
MNALAAAAASYALGFSVAEIAAGLEAFSGVAGRLRLVAGQFGARLLDDTYNANPGSFAAGIDVLCQYPGSHWLVMGDMGEMGADAEAAHEGLGILSRERGVSRLFGIGPLTAASIDAFGCGAAHFTTMDGLLAGLAAAMSAAESEGRDGLTVLIKGSRSMRMERVISRLRQE